MAPSTILQRNGSLKDMLNAALTTLENEEGLTAEVITSAINSGRMVLLANPDHPDVRPTLIGQPARVKVNANLGTSPLMNDLDMERRKVAAAMSAGADAIMDLSTAGDLDSIRMEMLKVCPLPLGTVPLYAVAQQYLDAKRDVAEITIDDLLGEIEKQARQGVDFMTVHCGLTRRGAELAATLQAEGGRVLGIVSRGGSILARWMRENKQENPLLTHYDALLDIARAHNVTLSLGDGLRPGAGADAGDAAQYEEVVTLGILQRRALSAGVQVMIEGPGHVPLSEVQAQVRSIKTITSRAPLYVLGPLVTDCAPGYDHIAGAIGGAVGVMHGVDFLCYLTPAEHLTLPSVDDVYQGVMASRIAAQAGEAALGTPRAVKRDMTMSEARKRLDWQAMTDCALDPCQVKARRKGFENEKECAMCGKFCAVRMLGDV